MTETQTTTTCDTSNVYCGKSLKNQLESILSLCKVTVTDSNVARLYPELTKDAIIIPAGEDSKNKDVLFNILEQFKSRGLTRDCTVAAIGGGVVGDITGLAAALYMRGIEWVSVPTTLLAMVDSGIGGKTAVDFAGVKNLIGAFWLPRDIVVSADFLHTLNDREWLCGCGELIKTCLLTEDAYKLLSENIDTIKTRDYTAVYPLIEMCIKIKSEVVTADAKERSVRKILNVGHTVSHALESNDGYKLSHGEYVLKGMLVETAMCRDFIDEKFFGELVNLISKFTTPPRTTAKAVLGIAEFDKKNTGKTITAMVVTAPGKVTEVRFEKPDFSQRYADAVKFLRQFK